MLVGGLKLTMLFPYWISQLCGGLIGAALAKVGDPPGGWAGGFGSARAAGVRGDGEWRLSDSFPVASNGTGSERVSRLVVSDSHDPMDCSPPGSSVHGIFQARILEWVAISFSRGSSRPRDQTWVSCIGGQILYHLSHQGSPPNFYPEGNTQRTFGSF